MKFFKTRFFTGLFFVLCIVPFMYATSWVKTFYGKLDEEAVSVTVTKDGGFILAGWTASLGSLRDDLLVIKLNSAGNVEWEKTYAGKLMDRAVSVEQTRDGGYIVGGYSKSWYPGRGISVVMWVLKLNKKGDVEWERAYGSIGCGYLRAIKQTHDGGYIVTGTAWDMGPRNRGEDILVLKLNSRGDIEWHRMYGGKEFDEPYDIIQTSGGGYVLVGITNSFGEKVGDYWILKLDKNGKSIWQKTFGGELEDRATGVVETADGGYLVAGWTRSFGVRKYDINAWLVKLSSEGKIEWQKSYGDERLNYANSVDVTTDGGFVVAGSANVKGRFPDLWLLKVKSDGNITWNRTYGGRMYDRALSVAHLPGEEYVVVGWNESFPRGMYKNIIVVESDSSGMVNGCIPGFAIGTIPISVRDTSVVARSTTAKSKTMKIFSVKTKCRVRDIELKEEVLCR